MIVIILAYHFTKKSNNLCCLKLIYCFPETTFIFDIGSSTHSSNFMLDYKYANQKLFLEGYYDVVLCSSINFVAFRESEPFKDHWNSFDNRLNSTVACICLVLIVVFPIYGFVTIIRHRNNLECKKFLEEYKVFVEDVS